MHKTLARAIGEGRVILFVGAGVSADLGLPTWRELIAHMAIELKYDPELFESSSATFMTLAEYYRLKHDEIGPLRSWMDTNWHISDEKLQASRIHQLLSKLNFKLIYTTNFDRLLERSFNLSGKRVVKITNVRDIERVQDSDVQIVKLHGDFDSDESIVLTETDYFRRLSFESPLDIKLRADSLGRSMLFLGYSVSDINIRILLFKLSQAWKESGYAKYQPQSYLFLQRPDPIQEAVLKEWGVSVITEDVDDPSDALPTFLERLIERSKL